MKTYFTKLILTIFILGGAGIGNMAQAQTCEWRLANPTFSGIDPDGAGPALASVTFTLQLRCTSGTIPDVTVITTGFSYQSAKAMVPAPPGCATVNSPANITLSPEFVAGGFLYTSVNQCNVVNVLAGGQTFDRTASGSLDASGAGVTLTTTFKNVFTVTLWTLSPTYPEGGYVMINSGSGGTPGGIGSYGVFTTSGGDFITNSLTFNTPLALGSAAVPVTFTRFDAKCNGNGTLISWATAQESNSRNFEIQKSINSTVWETVGNVAAAGNSASHRTYQQLDLAGGTALYRIKQVDMDGQYIYTNIERATCETRNIGAVIYPVPARDILNVVIKADRSAKTQLMVYETSGKLVRKVDVTLVNGNNSFKINTAGLAAGDYLIRSSNNEIDLNKKFTVVN